METIPRDSNHETKLDGPLREFVKETTVHGIRNATSSNSGPLRRLLWFIAFLAASAYLTFQLVTLALDYYSYPFKTVSRIVPKTSNVFPSVTICNLNKYNSKMVNFSTELKTIYSRRRFNFWPLDLNLTMEELRHTEPYSSILKLKHLDVIQMASPTLNMTFLLCFFDGDFKNCNEYISYTNTPMGRCFIFNNDQLTPRISSQPGIKGGFFAVMRVDQSEYTYSDLNTVGFTVFVHPRFDAPDIQNGILVNPGFYNEIRFSENRFEFLPEPYNSYGDAKCIPHTEVGGIATSKYSLSRCVTTKATISAKERCSCDWDNCTLDSFLTCFQPTFSLLYDNAMKTNRAGCDVPCLMITYPTKLSVTKFSTPDAMEAFFRWALRDNSRYIVCAVHEVGTKMRTNNNKRQFDAAIFHSIFQALPLYHGNGANLILSVCFDDFLVREDRHVPEYDNLSILGTLGGNVGLFLGASLLTLGEFLELVVLTLIGAVKRVHQLVKRRKPQKVKAGREDNIKLKYKGMGDVEAGYM